MTFFAKFPRKFTECKCLSDVESAIRAGDFIEQEIVVVRTKFLGTEDFEDFSADLEGQYSWLDISADSRLYKSENEVNGVWEVIQIESPGVRKCFYALSNGEFLCNLGQ